jgi:hypothetical protein
MSTGEILLVIIVAFLLISGLFLFMRFIDEGVKNFFDFLSRLEYKDDDEEDDDY